MTERRDPELTDLKRRLANSTVVGVVSQVDHEAARYRVRVGDLETDWIPRLKARAGRTRTYESLDEGEQVLVQAVSGDLSQGIIVGSIETEGRQAGTKGSEHRTVYPDGTVVEYDDEANAYNVTVPEGGGAVNVKSGGAVSVDGAKHVGVRSAQRVDVTGDVGTTVRGGGAVMSLSDGGVDITGGNIVLRSSAPIMIESPGLFHNGRNIGGTHRHVDVEPGGGRSGETEA